MSRMVLHIPPYQVAYAPVNMTHPIKVSRNGQVINRFPTPNQAIDWAEKRKRELVVAWVTNINMETK